MELILLSGALADLIRLWQRWEDKSPTIATQNQRVVEKGISRIAQFPESAPAWSRSSFRRMVIKKLSLGIFYQIHGQRIFVRAILDLHQSTETILCLRED